MRKNLIVITVVLLVSLVVTLSMTSVQSETSGFKYVGVSKCVTCHKSDAAGKQQDIWKASKHSQAWKTLETEAADKIAKDKGFTTKASETPQCIKCHVLGKDLVPDELDATFDKTDGVQCESCHGAGSDYKSMSIMKVRADAITNGLNVPSDKEAFCKTCHNPESPSYKEFKFDAAWDQIKHYKPKN